jgi:3-hydroxyisobutyrate dehydrogenase-like beta-hydroxyacid dehydrogenase
MTKRIGFIGLGTMGQPMVQALARAGAEVVVHDVRQSAIEEISAFKGVTATRTPANVAEAANVIFTCLPDEVSVRDVYRQIGANRTKNRADLVTCDCSTIGPEVSAEVYNALTHDGIAHFATPMIGGVNEARMAQLFFIVGGPRLKLPLINDYLKIMGRAHYYVGTASHAHTIKLLNNALGLANMMIICEIMALCVRSGVDLKTFYETIKQSDFAVFKTFERKVPKIVAGDFTPVGRLDLAYREIGSARDLAQQLAVETPMIELTFKAFSEAVRQGWGEEDFASVCHLAEARVGKRFSE